MIMKYAGWTHLLSLASTLGGSPVVGTPVDGGCLSDHVNRSHKGVIHVPISRRTVKSRLTKRDGQTAQIGLGDTEDISYSIELKIGSVTSSFTLDTGSSDLWAVTDTYTGKSQAPLYSTKSFRSSGIEISLLYGDSATTTFADGLVGNDTVSLAGITVPDQSIAAINRTNMTVFESGDIGLFGLGLPFISKISLLSFNPPPKSSSALPSTAKLLSKLSTRSYTTRTQRRGFEKPFSPSSRLQSRQDPRPQTGQTHNEISSAFFKSLRSSGNFLYRLALSNVLASPQFTLTLQRDQIQVGGNAGQLTLGGLPSGVKDDALTWMPVRLYSEADGGLAGPPESPHEKYPQFWEIALDDVYLDGQKLPRSSLVPANVLITAIIDSGNSIIRGPPDTIKLVNETIGSTFSCSSPHTLAFKIGGKMFPVDARDLVFAESENSAEKCTAAIAAQDVPQAGSRRLYTWSLGAPFLKSVLASFYFGNLTKPSQNSPRIGLLSTVPSDDGDQLKAVVSSALARKTGFPSATERAPTGAPTATQTNSAGVLQAPSPTAVKVVPKQI